MRIGLVGCVKSKVLLRSPARALYASPLFRGRRNFVETTCDAWYILSAKHGLVSPNRVLEPYEKTLTGAPRDAKRRWSDQVLVQIDDLGLDIANTVFEIHAGAEYRDFGLVAGLEQRGATVEVPTAHLSQGQQLAFYAGESPGSEAKRRSPMRSASSSRGSYAALAEHLAALEEVEERLAFTSLERILGRSLPASARKHRAWWANESDGTHSHARAWMGAGWLVDSVDLNTGIVQFRKGRR